MFHKHILFENVLAHLLFKNHWVNLNLTWHIDWSGFFKSKFKSRDTPFSRGEKIIKMKKYIDVILKDLLHNTTAVSTKFGIKHP